MSEIKAEILDLAKKLKEGIKVAKDGAVTIEEGLYEKNLPAEVTMDQLKLVQDHNNAFIAAASYVVGEEGIAAMKKNAELSEISAMIPTVGKDSIGIKFLRSRPVNDFGGTGEPGKLKYGSLSVKYDMFGTSTRGQLAKVKADLSEKATSAFGG